MSHIIFPSFLVKITNFNVEKNQGTTENYQGNIREFHPGHLAETLYFVYICKLSAKILKTNVLYIIYHNILASRIAMTI